MYPELALAKCQASSRRNSRKGKGDSVIRECSKIHAWTERLPRQASVGIKQNAYLFRLIPTKACQMDRPWLLGFPRCTSQLGL